MSSGLGGGLRRRLGRGLRRAPARPGDRVEQLAGAAALGAPADAADLAEVLGRGRAPARDLDEPGVAQHALHGAVLALGGALAPLDELACHGARGGVQPADSRQPFEDRLGVAFIGDGAERPALLQRPLEPPELVQAAFQLAGQLEQVHDVLARVCELLGRERARVPAREARRLGDLQPEHLAQQRVIGGLRAEPGEAGGDLRVEDVRHLAAQLAAQQRDVLATRRAPRCARPGPRGPRRAEPGPRPRAAGRRARSTRAPSACSGAASWIRHRSVR